MKLLGIIVDSIGQFMKSLFDDLGLSLDTIFYVGVGFLLLMVLFYIIKSLYAYEGRLSRTLDKLNRWLYYNQNIDTSNLIQFNNKMKKAPKNLRYHWQQFMLYREHTPSAYMSTYNCIEKPLHTSSYTANIKNMQSIILATVFFVFILGLAQSSYTGVAEVNVITAIVNAAIVPVIVAILGTLCLMLLRSMQNFNLSGLYQNFHLFQRYIDKASATLPEYVDFEVLFTKQEIKKGIPVLNEYLEKRARQEQEELEKARLNAVEHENYDFSQSGIDGALVLDRAMKETEVYLNIRQRLLSEIQQLDGEIESKKRNYENTSKEYQRKMQVSKENVERLRKQQEETTNRIESNYIKKQQNDEIKKQELLEKDQEDATVRFNQEITALQQEIDKRRGDLDGRKVYVQGAMLSEYQSFSNKIYEEVSKVVQKKFDSERAELIAEKDDVSNQLDTAEQTITAMQKEINELRNIMQKAGIEEGAHGGFYTEELKKEAEKVRKGKQNTKVKEPAKNENIELDEYGGYYDSMGYYWYPNGTYYDDKGNYFDEFGGHYDANGTYYPPETANGDDKQPQNVEVEQKVEEPVEVEIQPVQQEQIIEEPTIEDEQPTEEPVEETTEMPKAVIEGVFEDKPAAPVEEVVEEPKPEELSAEDRFGGIGTLENLEKPEEPVKVPGKPGRPKKLVYPNAVPKAPGKPGRPRKKPLEEQVKPAGTGKRGRPRKNPPADDGEMVAKPKTGKRGRPRKTPIEEVVAKPAGTGKRGRPRKNPPADDGEMIAKPKTGKRGRPRKTPIEEVVTKPAGTGKRGRPRKNAVQEVENVEENLIPNSFELPTEQFNTTFDDVEIPQEQTVEGPTDNSEEFDELKQINERIAQEQERLKLEQEELKNQLNRTLSELPDDTTDDI